ncbi:hypothetical protein ACE3NQ_17315 [Paenibacillus terreus]|uniref:MucBP domain-containing protein n=1 Tax=Paenibacillus terreus TaxID=1387834 RepID=A0ABV5BAE5_9BACL
MKKLLIASTIIGSLALTSTAAFAMVEESGVAPGVATQPVKKKAAVVQSANKETQNRIEYTKTTSYLEDGSVNAVVETWVDPVTHDKRIDGLVKEDDGTVHPKSTYLLENGTKWVEVARDNNGKAIRGKYYMLTEKESLEAEDSFTWDSFADIKAIFDETGWKNEGLLESKDGKKLIKLYGQNLLVDDIQPEGSTQVVHEYVQIDKDTGLPVKVERYAVDPAYEGGAKRSFGVDTYEYKYVDDKSLFDTTGIPMKEYSKLQWIHGVEY